MKRRHVGIALTSVALLAGFQGQTRQSDRNVANEWTIEGRVSNPGGSVSQAAVRVVSAPVYVKQVQVDADGHYSLNGTVAGNYVLTALKDGLGAPRPQSVSVFPGAHVHGIDFHFGNGSVSGRVFDRDRGPIAGVSVGAWVKGFKDGAVELREDAYTRTNQSGEFRIDGLSDGNYYLLAFRGGSKPRKRMANLKNVSERIPIVATVRHAFYPNSDMLEGAVRITLHPGEQSEGLDIAFDKTQTYCVYATVLASASGKGPEANFFVFQSIGGTFPTLASGTFPGEQELEVCDLPPGAYTVMASTSDRETHKTTSFFRTEFVVASATSTSVCYGWRSGFL